VQLTPLSTHWAPRKNKKKGTIFFGHPVYWEKTTGDEIRGTGRSWNEVKGIAGD
jgi:hypothetical protein